MCAAYKKISVLLAAALMLAALSACSGGKPQPSAQPDDMSLDVVPEAAGLSDYEMPEAEAGGTLTAGNEKVDMDYSNAADGYVMIRYLGSNHKVKVILTGPSSIGYTYNLALTGDYDVFSLSDGSGKYNISAYENVTGNRYSTVFSQDIDVQMSDEFGPFLRANKYVAFTPDGKVAELAKQLTEGCATTLDEIKAVYEYTVSNISYDYELAESVQSGYIPDLEAVLKSKKGICFDYAALMTAMLRSLGVPTKLVVGYTGDLYHAWINTYTEESGWVEATIYFDGSQWKLMDPTFAANAASDKEIADYIGNGENYTAKYLY